MTKGTVLYFKGFCFHDGGTSDKFLIILNTPKDLNTPYLCCKTTSKRKHTDKQGCSPEHNVYVLLPKEDLFPLKTWVQFNEFYPLEAKKLLSAHHTDKTVRIHGALKTQTISAIINCAKRSEDMSEYHLAMLKN